ncbi:hypothetical protein [Weissella tructae]|uniref:hypothetical protein n=1 Tax=Weissella tructae TaxID=887702 RepID=UPI001BDC2B74|nr:hypothetical protein [Weissella tructae]QVV90861.1 hypothetical protein KHQ32_04300 [Weissella tructae]
MYDVTQFIREDILQDIDKIGFSHEETTDMHLHAVTFVKSKVIFSNPDTVTLFELVEEFVHAKDSHTRKNIEYDIRNPDERDAHNIACQYLLERWDYYNGPINWLVFIELTGAPHYFEYQIIDHFKSKEDLTFGHVYG